MAFSWTNGTPEEIFTVGIEDYEIDTFHTLFALCEEFAALIQAYLRANAPWEDECMPGREYLRAEAFYPDQWSVGIRFWYDLDLYRTNCPEREYPWDYLHEFKKFVRKGTIAVFNAEGELMGFRTALGSFADDLWDRVRALYT